MEKELDGVVCEGGVGIFIFGNMYFFSFLIEVFLAGPIL